MLGLALGSAVPWLGGCRTAGEHREDADRVAYEIVEAGQRDAWGRTEPFTIETPAVTLRRRLMLEQDLPRSAPESLGTEELEPPDHWPDDDYLERDRDVDDPYAGRSFTDGMTVTLTEALGLAARNSRDYQDRKESVFLTALDLDLRRDAFRTTFGGLLASTYEANLAPPDVQGIRGTADLSASKLFANGATATTGIVIDLAKLLTQDEESSRGLAVDATVVIPLLSGSGAHIVTEPLKQAERNVLYALWDFDRFRREFAVRVASDYLSVLQQLDSITNAEANYIRLIESEIESRDRLEADRLSQVELDQITQDVLRARSNWIAARENYSRQLDRFKITLGLPTDAIVELEREDLARLAELGRERVGAALEDQGTESDYRVEDRVVIPLGSSREDAGPLEFDEEVTIGLAFGHRRDLMVARGRVADALRRVVVDADALRAGLTLVLSGAAGERRSIGSAGADDAEVRLDEGDYAIGLDLDLPWEKTADRNVYREALIALERSVRDFQDLEDQVKLQLRDALSSLRQAREDIRIQFKALDVARRRVESTKDFFEAGRPGVQIRDILEAEDDLVSAQNALTAALVDYRVRELELQRDMGVLVIEPDGMWREFRPEDLEADEVDQGVDQGVG